MRIPKLTPTLCFCAFITQAMAVDYHFNVADGDWYTPTNWTPNGVPQGGGGNHAYIDAGKTVTIAQDTDGGGSGFDLQDTFVGRGAGNIGTLNQSAGMFNANNGWLFVGDNGGTGSWNMTGTSSLSTGRFYIGGVRGSNSIGSQGNLSMNTTGTVTLTSDFSVGTAGGTGNVVITNGTLNANTWAIIGETESGRGSTGAMIQNGGTVNFGATDAGGRFWIGSHENGAQAVSSGSYTLNAGTLTSRNIELGHGGTGYSGTFTQTGGYYHVLGGNDDSSIAGGTGSTGLWTMSGGTADIDSHFQIGRNGSGTFNQTGGTITQNQWPVIARYAGSTGVANISGGTFNQANASARLIIGEEGNGTANISGTANVISAGGVSIGHLGATANGTMNLNGGTLTTPFIGQGSGIAKVNLNGGVLKASASQAEFFTMLDTVNGFIPTATPMASSSIEVRAGGAKINTNGFNIGTSAGLNGVGGLTKSGNGTLTLAGVNEFEDITTVVAGILKINGSSISATTVQGTATLAGNGTITNNVSVLLGGTISPGNSIGTLTIGGNLAISGSLTNETDNSNLSDLLNVTGTVTLGSSSLINLTHLGAAPAIGDTFLVIKNDSTDAIIGQFSNLADAATIMIGGMPAVVDYNFDSVSGTYDTGNDLAIRVVPEPSAMILGFLSLGLLARRRRA